MNGLPNFVRVISIHAPREGSDQVHVPVDHAVRISIHAPREGSDRHLINLVFVRLDFNPRSP